MENEMTERARINEKIKQLAMLAKDISHDWLDIDDDDKCDYLNESYPFNEDLLTMVDKIQKWSDTQSKM